jgi:hypothetical protein
MQNIDLYYILSLICGTFLGIGVMYSMLYINPERLSAIKRLRPSETFPTKTWNGLDNDASNEKKTEFNEMLLKQLPNHFEDLQANSDSKIVLVNHLLTKRSTFMGVAGNYISFITIDIRRIGPTKINISCALDYSEFDRTMNTLFLIVLIFMILPISAHFLFHYVTRGNAFLSFDSLLGHLIPSMVLLIIPWRFWNKSFVAKKIFATVDLAIRNVF